MNTPNGINPDNAHGLIERIRFLNYPYLYCHSSWVEKIYDSSDLGLIQYSRKHSLASKFITCEVGQYVKNTSLQILLGEYGYLTTLSLDALELLYRKICYYTLFVFNKNDFLNLDESLQSEFKRFNSIFSENGALYRNPINSIAPTVLKTSNIIFGSSLKNANKNVCQSFGFYVFRVLINSEVSPYFLTLLAMKSDASIWTLQQKDIVFERTSKKRIASVVLNYLQSF